MTGPFRRVHQLPNSSALAGQRLTGSLKRGTEPVDRLRPRIHHITLLQGAKALIGRNAQNSVSLFGSEGPFFSDTYVLRKLGMCTLNS